MNFVSLVFDLVRIILGMLFVDFKQGQFGSKCITKASWTWGEKCHISNYLQFLTFWYRYLFGKGYITLALFPCNFEIIHIQNLHTLFHDKALQMFERKYEIHAKLHHKILISAFAKYLTAFAKVLYLKGTWITRLWLDPILRFSIYFLIS